MKAVICLGCACAVSVTASLTILYRSPVAALLFGVLCGFVAWTIYDAWSES